MTNETMKDGERAADRDSVTREQIEQWAALAGFTPAQFTETTFERFGEFAIFARQARATSPQSGEKGEEPVAWALESELNARESTCRAHLWFTDPHNTSWVPLYTRAAAPQTALTDEQRETLNQAACFLEQKHSRYAAETLRALLTQAPTERMSDAPHPPLSDGLMHVPCALQLDHASRQYGWLFIPHADGQWVTAAKLDEFSLQIIAYWRDAARKAEIERSDCAGGEA